MSNNKFTSKSQVETQKLAQDFATKIKGAQVICFRGELGTGKTTFIKALLKELGVKQKIVSPTFVILKSFHPKDIKDVETIYHIDAYRIESPEDITGTGIREAIKDKKGLTLIEWADNIKGILPKDVIWVSFTYGNHPTERHITISRC